MKPPTDPSSAPSTPSYSKKKLNENTDITSKKQLTAEIHYITNSALEDKPDDIIQTELVFIPYKKHIDLKYHC